MRAKIAFCLGIAALLTACSVQAPQPAAAEDPPGTFQMMGVGTLPGGEPQLAVIDTRRGKISRCTVFGDAVRCAPEQPVFAPR